MFASRAFFICTWPAWPFDTSCHTAHDKTWLNRGFVRIIKDNGEESGPISTIAPNGWAGIRVAFDVVSVHNDIDAGN